MNTAPLPLFFLDSVAVETQADAEIDLDALGK